MMRRMPIGERGGLELRQIYNHFFHVLQVPDIDGSPCGRTESRP